MVRMMALLASRPAKPPITPSVPPTSVAINTGASPITSEIRPP
jgi:hypothetical protein